MNDTTFPSFPVTFGGVLVGILSDTHDRLDPAIAGMKLLSDAGAEFYIHCGDVGGERILDLLAGVRAALVWGNNDWDRKELSRYAGILGIQVLEPLGELELDGKRFAVTHGDEPRLVQRVLVEQRHDYLLLGHSHLKADQRHGKVRLINPGALHRAVEKSVAVLDTVSNELRFLRL